MAWMKRIELLTGRARRDELDPAGSLVLKRSRRQPNPMGLRQVSGEVRVFATTSAAGDVSWFCTPSEFRDPSSAGSHPAPGAPPPQPIQTLKHGATLNAGDSAYVFLDYVEHRDPAREGVASESLADAEAWAAWLEAQGDPFFQPLRAMLAGRIFVGRERWWLEGCDRGMTSLGSAFEMANGFLTRAELCGGTLPLDLQLLHFLNLRAASGLEELTIDLAGFLPASFWVPFARSSFWEAAPWPLSLKRLRLSTSNVKALESRRCAEEIGAALPEIVVEP